MVWLKKLVGAVVILGGVGAVTGWVLSAPARLDSETLAKLGPGDAATGKRIFYAGGCTSCHAKPGSQGEARLQLAGGLELKTLFGTFVPPNISQDPKDGIGAWSVEDLANAMLKGVSPSGQHFYPAFPYASYARMNPADIADLYAFLKTLPAVAGKTPANSLNFPFNIRRGIGLWKLLYLSDQPVVAFPEGTPDPVMAGRYLVEGPGHCGECHTPRDFAGGPKKNDWLAGAVAAEGRGIVPNITSGEGGLGDWSEDDIANYLETGFTPDFDSVGGAMVDVQRNMAELAPEDRAAIAAYLKATPPHPNGYPARKKTAN
ncbi:cytochrome c [Mesorhizobium sp.]|uniref:cytochrome c n=1 Tax=Mesorhizobium sp. TaxID=1871066 RepID=UPI000FE9F9D2|nr:cytochrome c [Mesorhizobium sp.]RWC63905.1 MAG: c-type cytochrome [Mesorhizobium sp.]RWC64874.1 MAG: c-type cytochrome [Mesorhizobium sp.]